MLPVVETAQNRTPVAEEPIIQSQNQQDVRVPWRGTIVPVRDVALALDPVEKRLIRRRREVHLAVEDIQNITGRLRSVGMGLETLGSIRDVGAAANLILRMRRDLELGEEVLMVLDGRHGRLGRMVELDEEELTKTRSGVNLLLRGVGLNPIIPPPWVTL